jgi:curved DNA-binding protein CbpA
VASKTYYDLLELAASASADEIKRAFRVQIARYHPDKVQHLGEEFQAIAATRAAELTEAYRVLSGADTRAAYDRTLASGAPAPSAAGVAPPPPAPDRVAPVPTADQEAADPKGPTPSPFTEERATRDEFIRRASMGRVRQALTAVASDYDESSVRGFDFACVPKAKLFGRSKRPRMLGRFVPCVDGPAVVDSWSQAGRWAASDEVCVLLVGSSLAAPRELATAIAAQRRKAPAKVTVIPIDARNWDAHVPTDAPAIAKDLLARLKSGG